MAGRTLRYDDIYRLKQASDPRLSPDGSTVAFVITTADRDGDENHHAIWTVRVDGGEPSRLTQGTKDFHPRWAPDGSGLAFLRAVGEDPPQIWLLPHSGEARKLGDMPLGATSFVWSPDSSRLAVLAPTDLEGDPTSDDERKQRANAPVAIRSASFKADGAGLLGSKRTHLFAVDAKTGAAEQLTKGDLNVVTPAWSPDGRSIAFGGTTEDREIAARTHLYVAGTDGAEPTEVAEWTDQKGTALAPFFAPNGKTLAFVGSTHTGPGHSRLYSVPSRGGPPKELAPDFDRNVMVGGPGYPGAPPFFASDDVVIFCARDRGCTNTYALRDGAVTKIAGGSDSVISGVDHAAGYLAYIASAPDIAADVFVSAADGSDERRLTDLNRELLDEVTLHTARPRTFTAPDGLQVCGWVIEGNGPGPRPLLLDIHGGPHNAWSPTLDPVHLYHQALAEAGWSILLLNPRGSDGYGEDFMTAVVGAWGEADQDDFHAAIDDLVAEGVADPDRLAVCGYSYGGHMTNWLTGHTDRFKAAVSGGCVSNLTSFYGTSDMGWWLGAFEMGGETYELRDRFTELSPINYVEHVSTPTLVLHGEADERCPVGQAEEWFVSLRRRGVETEFVRYPGASHLFILSGRPSHRIDYNQRIEDWVTRG